MWTRGMWGSGMLGGLVVSAVTFSVCCWLFSAGRPKVWFWKDVEQIGMIP